MTSRIEPEDLALEVRATSAIQPVEPDENLVQWTARLMWRDSSDWESDEDDDVPAIAVAVVEAYTIERENDPLFEVLDAHSGDLAAYICLFDGQELDEDLSQDLFDDEVVILGRVEVPAEWRGRRLGLLAASSTLRILGQGRGIAACYPSAFGLDRDDPRHDAETERLERVWGRFGFERWKDGVWVLNLETDTLDATHQALIDELRR